MRRDGAGDGHVFSERLGFIDENVRPIAGEALIVDHVALRHGVSGVAHEWYRVVGIAEIFVDAACFNRRIEAELAAGVKVERLWCGGLGRPRIVAAPHIGSGLKDDGLGQRLAFALQIMLEEGELNVGAEVVGGFGIELHIAQMAAIAARPAAVHPWAFNERGRRIGIEFADGVEGAVRALEVFGIKPSADHQHRALHVLHVPRQIARLPVVVIGVVLELVVEEPVGALQIELVEVRDVAGLEIELVTVWRAEVERTGGFGQSRILSADGRTA